MWIHQTTKQHALVFESSFFVARFCYKGGFWGCPSIGKSCSQFFRLKHHVPAIDSCEEAVLSKETYHSWSNVEFFMAALVALVASHLYRVASDRELFMLLLKSCSSEFNLWTCVIQDRQISQMHLVGNGWFCYCQENGHAEVASGTNPLCRGSICIL